MIPTAARAAQRLLQDRAYEELKGLIQGGTYPPGTFLSERRLAGRLGMSKTPIKSALTRLGVEGFVTVSPQQGIVVREPTVNEVLDLFDIREALEPFVVRKLAGHLTPDQVVRLRQNLRSQVRAARAKEVAESTILDAEFHTMICEFLGNHEISQALWRMREKLHRLILGNFNRIPERMDGSVKEHAAIAEALIAGRGEEAAARVVKHLDVGRQLILRR
ncbi:MAG TPA: GntR family transcriptional regulator [Planctomycetota bacterium]|nr:GntR family transcriptional regulator [Planctomycetota bacterium]